MKFCSHTFFFNGINIGFLDQTTFQNATGSGTLSFRAKRNLNIIYVKCVAAFLQGKII